MVSDNKNEPGLVTVFRLAGGGIDEMEVMTVQQLLESNGIDTVLVGDSPLPNLAEEIRVAEEDAARAQQLIADALAAGPAGAAKPRRNPSARRRRSARGNLFHRGQFKPPVAANKGWSKGSMSKSPF